MTTEVITIVLEVVARLLQSSMRFWSFDPEIQISTNFGLPVKNKMRQMVPTTICRPNTKLSIKENRDMWRHVFVRVLKKLYQFRNGISDSHTDLFSTMISTDPKQDMIAAIVHVIAKVITLIFCLVLISFAIADPTKSASERARF